MITLDDTCADTDKGKNNDSLLIRMIVMIKMISKTMVVSVITMMMVMSMRMMTIQQK